MFIVINDEVLQHQNDTYYCVFDYGSATQNNPKKTPKKTKFTSAVFMQWLFYWINIYVRF